MTPIFFQRLFCRGLFMGLFVCLLCNQLFAQAPKHLDKPKFAGIPMVNYNKSFGWMFGGFASMYFPMNKNDTISPASMVMVGGVVTTNKTWLSFGMSQLYYKKDLFRTILAGGLGEQNFQFYADMEGVTGVFIPYSTTSKFFFVQQLVRTYKKLYMGVDVIYYRVGTVFADTFTSANRNYVALGVPVTLDTRDNVQNPSNGWYVQSRINRFDEAFGSATEYTKMDIDASYYKSKKPTNVLATKLSVSTGLGNVPFEAQTVVGGKVMRGYSDGEYRGDQVYALQSEYRWTFYKKLGAVFFAGLATPVNKGEKWDSGDILPSAGVGIRYMMIPDLRLNVGVDVAFGKGDNGIYFRIGEAF